jgi:hypothetical protein
LLLRDRISKSSIEVKTDLSTGENHLWLDFAFIGNAMFWEGWLQRPALGRERAYSSRAEFVFSVGCV